MQLLWKWTFEPASLTYKPSVLSTHLYQLVLSSRSYAYLKTCSHVIYCSSRGSFPESSKRWTSRASCQSCDKLILCTIYIRLFSLNLLIKGSQPSKTYIPDWGVIRKWPLLRPSQTKVSTNHTEMRSKQQVRAVCTWSCLWSELARR